MSIRNSQLDGQRWGAMLTISIVLHLSLFIAVVFLPAFKSSEADIPYMPVTLVDMPAGTTLASNPVSAAVKADTTAKRIETRKDEKKTPPKEDAVPIKKAKTPAKKDASESVEDAISKIKEKVQKEDTSYVDKAIADLKKKTGNDEKHVSDAIATLQKQTGVASGKGTVGSLSRTFYQETVRAQIQGNWDFLGAAQARKDLEVTVLLKVKEDGTILETEFIEKSRDSNFDQSVLKAIKLSNPITPFPEGWNKTYEEFKITFTLKEMLDN